MRMPSTRTIDALSDRNSSLISTAAESKHFWPSSSSRWVCSHTDRTLFFRRLAAGSSETEDSGEFASLAFADLLVLGLSFEELWAALVLQD